MTEDNEFWTGWTVFHNPTANLIYEADSKEECVRFVARQVLAHQHLADESPADYSINYNSPDIGPIVPTEEIEEAMADPDNWESLDTDFNSLQKWPDGRLSAHVVTDRHFPEGGKVILDDSDPSMTQPVMMRVRCMLVVLEEVYDAEMEPYERAAINRLSAAKEVAFNQMEAADDCEDCPEDDPTVDHTVDEPNGGYLA